MELASIYQNITNLTQRNQLLIKHFNLEDKSQQLEEVLRELAEPSVWSNTEKFQKLNQKKAQLENICNNLTKVQRALNDSKSLLELAELEQDEQIINSIVDDLKSVSKIVDNLEFKQMFNGKLDANSAYLDIQSGSGGTEAQDWAEMLLRMYLRWAEQHNFKTTLMEVSQGEVAGIKSATIHIDGEYAFGWLHSEAGIHRLVRKSPFNANGKRHTSFASIFVSPEINNDIAIDINPADLRIDTYRASGAGGQHVNKTESAVRITHIPSNTVVQCQDGRSQHSNKEKAMKQLHSKLYELEIHKKNSEKQAVEQTKSNISWGQQIRSYVLDQSRIKDLRTNIENFNTQEVLDGNLDNFIKASLRAGY